MIKQSLPDIPLALPFTKLNLEKWANKLKIPDNQVGHVSVDFRCTILRAFNTAYEIEVSSKREFYSDPMSIFSSNVQTWWILFTESYVIE